MKNLINRQKRKYRERAIAALLECLEEINFILDSHPSEVLNMQDTKNIVQYFLKYYDLNKLSPNYWKRNSVIKKNGKNISTMPLEDKITQSKRPDKNRLQRNKIKRTAMSKELTMWCVFDEKDTPIPESLERARNQCIRGLFHTKESWDYWRKKRGHTCRKVRVTIEEVKP